MDEAQMVESSTAKAAEMALKLSTINKWAISGTPFVKGSGLVDLYGLLLFLKVNPWGLYRAWFRHAVQLPIENVTQHSEGAKNFLEIYYHNLCGAALKVMFGRKLMYLHKAI